MPKNIIIIGAGVSGLSTGIYLQMNGFKTSIVERHVLPGGCATAWSREGYIFDYCIDWLIGSGKDNSVNQVWRELGALSGKKITNFDLFNRVVTHENKEIIFYNNPDKLFEHLSQISSQDIKLIGEFCRDLRKFINLEIYPSLKPKKLASFKERFLEIRQVMPSIFLFMRTAGMPMRKFADKFKNPSLSQAMNYIFFQDPETFPLLPFLYNMACAHKNNAGFPEGGSLGLSYSIAERYKALGGEIFYGNGVQKILVENNKAVGVTLKKGQPKKADYIISAADALTTIYDFLDGNYVDKFINNFYQNLLKQPGVLFPSVVSVFFGLKGEVGQNEPHTTSFLLDPHSRKKLPGALQNALVLQHRTRYDKSFAKPGHSVIHCTYFSDYNFWQNLRSENKADYRKRKQEVIDFIRDFLAARYENINSMIEVVEVATPATTKRYTGNFQGSIFGFKAFSKAEDCAEIFVNKYRMKLPNLSNFYMTGQWVLGGGLPRASLSGRYVAQYLCDELKMPFVAHECEATHKWDMTKLGFWPQLDLFDI